jgi:hypothetical protein
MGERSGQRAGNQGNLQRIHFVLQYFQYLQYLQFQPVKSPFEGLRGSDETI